MHINLKGEITVEQALAAMRANPERCFWLAFVKATGKERGNVKVVARCKYGAPEPGLTGDQHTNTPTHQTTNTPTHQHTKPSLHVERGTLPMTDHDTGEYITPLISHIIGYNLKKVIH